MLHSIVGLERALRVPWCTSADGMVLVSSTKHVDEEGRKDVKLCRFMSNYVKSQVTFADFLLQWS